MGLWSTVWCHLYHSLYRFNSRQEIRPKWGRAGKIIIWTNCSVAHQCPSSTFNLHLVGAFSSRDKSNNSTDWIALSIIGVYIDLWLSCTCLGCFVSIESTYSSWQCKRNVVTNAGMIVLISLLKSCSVTPKCWFDLKQASSQWFEVDRLTKWCFRHDISFFLAALSWPALQTQMRGLSLAPLLQLYPACGLLHQGPRLLRTVFSPITTFLPWNILNQNIPFDIVW